MIDHNNRDSGHEPDAEEVGRWKLQGTGDSARATMADYSELRVSGNDLIIDVEGSKLNVPITLIKKLLKRVEAGRYPDGKFRAGFGYGPEEDD